MVSQDKLIKQGIYLTDNVFDEIITRLSKGIKASDTLEAFINKTKDYTMNNPLVVNGFKDDMLEIILRETNNHKFGRPAQKELVRATIENRVGGRIVDVGEDIKESVRDIVKQGYNNNLSQDEIAEDISHRVTTIKNTRARTIARTEIARTATASDYVINKERGATHFTVDCRDTCCTKCAKAYNWGKIEYSIDQVDKLPPFHPNCRCYPMFFIKDGEVKATTTPPASNRTVEPTPAQLKKNLNAGEREKYNNYKRNIPKQVKWLRDNPDASAEDIAKHKKRLAFLQKKLDELTRKALGGKAPVGSDKPKAAPKPKAKPKETPKPKATPKPKTPNKPIPEIDGTLKTPTSKQLKKNLDSIELKRYKRRKKEIKERQKWLKDNPDSPEYDRSRKFLVSLINDYDNLTRKALGLKPIPSGIGETKKPKPKVDTTTKPKSTVKLEAPFDESKQLTKEQVNKMDFKQLAEHHGAEYQGIQKYDYDGKNYHVIKQTFEDGREFILRFEDKAVKSYAKKNVATANEIIHEVFKVPESLRIETREIWFKDTQQGIRHTFSKSGLDTLGKNTGGYNNYRLIPNKDGDYEHCIVINPKYFKLHGKDGFRWVKHPDDARAWKMTIFHEFLHSGDLPQWGDVHSNRKEGEYRKIEEAEKGFTWYGNSKYRGNDYSESYAEHGGYIAYMESNPSEQNKKIEILHYEEGKIVRKKINYEEYKKIYPKHYEYFMKRFKEGF